MIEQHLISQAEFERQKKLASKKESDGSWRGIVLMIVVLLSMAPLIWETINEVDIHRHKCERDGGMLIVTRSWAQVCLDKKTILRAYP